MGLLNIEDEHSVNYIYKGYTFLALDGTTETYYDFEKASNLDDKEPQQGFNIY